MLIWSLSQFKSLRPHVFSCGVLASTQHVVNWKVKTAPKTYTVRGLGLISYRKFPEEHIFFILDLDFQWVDGAATRGICPQCCTEDSEYGDLRSYREPWEPTFPNGELKRRRRRLLAGDLADPTPWQLTHWYGLEQGGRTAGRSHPREMLLSRNTGEIPAENCPTGKLFAALHMSEQSSFWPHEI